MKYDLIIVGGGMVGTALACTLPTNLKIALLDATPLAVNDPRLIALNANSCSFLKNLTIWPLLAAHAAPIKKVHVSARSHFGTMLIAAEEINLSALGYVIPAKHINAALDEQLKSLSNITLFRPATLKNFFQDENGVTVRVENETLIGNFLIGADGTHSTVRQILQVPTKIVDYQQSAIVTVTELHRSHADIAYERFIKSGAIAMLPLPGNQCATIWTDQNETISHLMQLSDADFLAQLQHQFGYRLGRLLKIHKRFTFPLKLIQAEKQVHGKVILIGNAAHTLHPIAAQGFNLALQEVTQLSILLKNNSNLNQFHYDTKFSMRLSHYLPQIFANDFFPIIKARQLGLLGLDLFTPLKKRFMRKTIPFLE